MEEKKKSTPASEWFKNLDEYKDYEWDQEGLPLKDAKKKDVSKVNIIY